MLSASLESRLPVFHLKLGKDPAMPSSHRPISLLDRIRKIFENILARILCEVSESGLLRNGQFVFRPDHSTKLQLFSYKECSGTLADGANRRGFPLCV